MDQLQQLLNKVKPWIAIAGIMGVILVGYFAYQGFRYYQAQSDESSLAEEISDLDRKIAALSPVKDPEGRLEALKERLQSEEPKLKDRDLLFEARKLLLEENIDALKQQLEAKELLLEDGNLQLEALNGLFQYPSTDELMKVVANTALEMGMTLISISSGELQIETVGPMDYQVRRVGLTLGGEPADFSNFLAQLRETVPVATAADIRLSKLDEDPTAQVTLMFFLSPVTVPTPTPKPAAATAVPYPTPTLRPPASSSSVGSTGSSPRQGR